MAASTVGALRVSLGLNSAQYEQKMRQAQRTAQTTAKRIEGSLKGAFSPLTDLRGLAVTAGVVSLAALGKQAVDTALKFKRIEQAMAIATGSTEKAAKEFDFLRDLADRLGLRFLTLANSYTQMAAAARGTNIEGEETRRIFEAITKAIVATGGSAEQAEGALLAVQQIISKGTVSAEELRGQLGERLPGAFQIAARAMGVTTAELGKLLEQGAIASGDFLPRFADQLGRELPAAVQTADAPFQRFQTTLDDIANSAAKGFMDELGESTEDLTGVLVRLQSSGAMEAFGSFLGEVISLGAGFLGVVGDIIDALDQLDRMLPSMSSDSRGILFHSPRGNAPSEVGIGELGQSVTGNIRDAPTRTPTRAPIKFNPKKSGGRKGPSAESLAAKAEREREAELRRLHDVDRQLRSAKLEELAAALDLAEDENERYNTQKEILDLEGEQRTSDLNLSVALKDLDGETRKQVDLIEAGTKEKRIQLLLEERSTQAREDVYRLEVLDLDIQSDMLEIRAALATTAAERRDIELRLLEVATQQERLDIARLKASKSWADQEEGRRREVALNERMAGERSLILDRTKGPLESYRDSLPQTAAEINEALQVVAVDGLRALEDGILSVIDGTKSLGAAFRDMASQIITDLLRIQIQRGFANILGSVLNIGAAAASGGIGGAGPIASGTPIPGSFGGFASGGFTGFLPEKRIAGFVHGSEFVMPASAVRRIGLGNLEAMRKGMPVANDRGMFHGGDTYNPTININAPMTMRQARETGNQAASTFQRRLAMTKRNGM